MNQFVIGKFIALKRREKNLTQEQLGEIIGVSHKSVSKWETGKCMPDYSIIEILCKELGISVSELLNGEENENENVQYYNDGQMLDLIGRVQSLEKQKHANQGLMVTAMGIALSARSYNVGGTPFRDAISGFITGVSVAAMFIGTITTARATREEQ
ncbi:MAG: helix-turn-helix domain-containing protein [Eubacteriaceae bacterium]|nr:helix-turn-helix domain-containing protein [Eubacteriaceae bacterium]